MNLRICALFALLTPFLCPAATTLSGAGATFPGPLYNKWIASYARKVPDLTIEYNAVGSGAGVDALRLGKVDFAASDEPISDALLSQFPVKVRQIPSVIGGVVPIFDLAGSAADLRFNAETLAGIFSGKIKRWNDPKIKALNRKVNLPALDIIVVHRSDPSGTTFVFSNFLAKSDSAWNSEIGCGKSLKWPVGLAVEGNQAVAELVKKTPGAIGYVEFIFALENRLNYGSVQNSSGNFIKADLSSLPKGVTNTAAPEGYPIASFTYLLIPETLSTLDKQQAMRDFLTWVLTHGQKQCEALGYAALPEEIASQALAAIAAPAH